MSRELPPATAQPCSDCPWRRCSAPGWLGPMDAHGWLLAAHTDAPIACHQTIVADDDGNGDWAHPSIRQCRGAAIFRANVCKMPRDPAVACGPVDEETVFSNNAEFGWHHEPR